MKELKSICDDLMIFFNIDNIEELGDKLYNVLFSKNKNEMLKQYLEIVEDIETDWIQKIFQYYKADREKGLSQDYTPPSLGKCVSKILYNEDSKTVLDVCAGSGSLTLQLHKLNEDLNFVCLELDDNVIPFLLFNLCLNNVEAVVCKYDVINNKLYKAYKLTKTASYSNIEVLEKFELEKYDIVISNPPYNLKINNPIKNDFYKLAAQKDGNAFFTIFCVNHCKGTAGLILPAGCAGHQNKEALALRRTLVENGIVSTVVMNPEKMFESTPTTTLSLILDVKKKEKETPILINAHHSEYIRYQNGQFGGGSHTKRTYKKKFNCYSDENINEIIDTINNKKIIDEYSVIPTFEQLEDRHYSLYAGQYFEVKIEYIDITQEEYDEMVEKFNNGFADFVSGLLSFQEELKKNNFLKI